MSAKMLSSTTPAWRGAAPAAILEAAGYEVVEAEDGMAALERYFVEKPDVVLLDLVMKGMYGLDVLDQAARDGSGGPGRSSCRPTSRRRRASWSRRRRRGLSQQAGRRRRDLLARGSRRSRERA